MDSVNLHQSALDEAFTRTHRITNTLNPQFDLQYTLYTNNNYFYSLFKKQLR